MMTQGNDSRLAMNVGVGLALGVSVGVGIGAAFGNIGVGITIGVAVGTGIGAAVGYRPQRRRGRPPRRLREKQRPGDCGAALSKTGSSAESVGD